MAIKQGREYRALQDFSLVPREENSPEYRVRGTAIVFNTPTVLWGFSGSDSYSVRSLASSSVSACCTFAAEFSLLLLKFSEVSVILSLDDILSDGSWALVFAVCADCDPDGGRLLFASIPTMS